MFLGRHLTCGQALAVRFGTVGLTYCMYALQLAESLKGNSSLKLLDIGGNNIGPEGIKVLLESLRGNETLKNLELGYNPIGEEGAKHLADVIKYDLGVSILLFSGCCN